MRRVSPILGEAALKRKPIRIASAFLRLSLLSYRPEIFVKPLNLRDNLAVVRIFGKSGGVIITDALKPRVHIGACEDLVIAKAVRCAVARPCKFTRLDVARAPTINPACLQKVLVIMGRGEGFAVTINEGLSLIHI